MIELERDFDLGVDARLPCGLVIRHLFAGDALLVQFECGLGLVGSAGLHERLAPGVGGAEVFLLVRRHLLEIKRGVLEIAHRQPGFAEQITDRTHGVVDVVSLLQRLNGVSRLVEPQASAADEEMPGPDVVVDGQCLAGVLDDLRGLAGQSVCVGQVEQEVGLGRLVLQRLSEGVDGFLSLAGVVVSFAGVEQSVEVGVTLALGGGKPREDHRGQHYHHEEQQVLRVGGRLARSGICSHGRENSDRSHLDQGETRP